MPSLRNFGGGLNKREEPTRVPLNQGLEFKNIDNSGGVLKSAKSNKPLPNVNVAQQNSVSQEDSQFQFYAPGQLRAYAIVSAFYSPSLKFGPRKQYEVSSIELQNTDRSAETGINDGNVFFQGDVNIPPDENYQITLTTIESDATPSVITLLTSNGKWRDPRDSSNNQLRFNVPLAQVAPFVGKLFSIIVLPVSMTDSNPLGLDSNEIPSRLNGKTFFRQVGTSLVEYNGAAYFTQRDGPPQKVFATTRNQESFSTTVAQAYSSERVYITDRTGKFYQTIELTAQGTLNQLRYGHNAYIPTGNQSSSSTRLSGNKALQIGRRSNTANYLPLRVGVNNSTNQYTLNTREGRGSRFYSAAILDLEGITNYDFVLLYNKRLHITQDIYADLSSIEGNPLDWRMSVLDYPLDHFNDPLKTDNQNLNTSRENISQTKILIYTQNGTGHIVSFTRDASTTGKLSLKYIQPTGSVDLDSLNADLLPAIEQHLLKGIDTDDNLRLFSNKMPLFATIATAGDMAMLNNDPSSFASFVTSMQVRRRVSSRGSNLLYVVQSRAFGAVVPTGYNRNNVVSVYNIDRNTAAVTKVNDDVVRCPILLNTRNAYLGYLGVANGATIRVEIDTTDVIEDTANLSLVEPLGIEGPGTGLPLQYGEHDPFDNNSDIFPTGADAPVLTSHRVVKEQNLGGQSTRPERTPVVDPFNDNLSVQFLVVVQDVNNNNERISKMYTEPVQDNAIDFETFDRQEEKGCIKIFGKKIGCRIERTEVGRFGIRDGITFDFTNYFNNNPAGAFNLMVAVRIPILDGARSTCQGC